VCGKKSCKREKLLTVGGWVVRGKVQQRASSLGSRARLDPTLSLTH
jgi:hypothetical protein